MKTLSLPAGWSSWIRRACFLTSWENSLASTRRWSGSSPFRASTAGSLPDLRWRRDTRVPSASRFSALIENCSAIAVSVLTEHVADRFRMMDAPDRLAQQIGDRKDLQIREFLPRGGDRVGHDDFLHGRLLQLL